MALLSNDERFFRTRRLPGKWLTEATANISIFRLLSFQINVERNKLDYSFVHLIRYRGVVRIKVASFFVSSEAVVFVSVSLCSRRSFSPLIDC